MVFRANYYKRVNPCRNNSNSYVLSIVPSYIWTVLNIPLFVSLSLPSFGRLAVSITGVPFGTTMWSSSWTYAALRQNCRGMPIPPPFLSSIAPREKRRRRAAAGRTSATKSRPVGKKREARRRRRRRKTSRIRPLRERRMIARRDDRDKEANVNEADRPRISPGLSLISGFVGV